MNRLVSVTVATLLLCGCAATPSTIQPARVPSSPYQDTPCRSLEKLLEIETSSLQTLYGLQAEDMVFDAFLNLLIPGLGALTPDEGTNIANSKGRILVIREEYSKRCVE